MSSLSDELGFWHFDEDLMVFSDGSLGAGFKLSGFDITCASETAINQLSQNLENLLVSCDEGVRLQVFYKLSSNIENLIKSHEDLSNKIDGPYKRIAAARLKFYKENQEQKKYFVPEIYFFIRSQSFNMKKQNLLSSNQKFEPISASDYSDKKEKFLRVVKQAESLLSSAKLGPTVLNSSEWFDLVFEYLNYDRAEKIGNCRYREPESFLDPSVSEQLTLTDMTWDKDSINIGDYKFRTISLALLPEGQTFASMGNIFSQVPFHFWISQSIHLLDQVKEKSSLELKRRIAHSMASGSQNVSDLESENKLGQIEGLLSNLLEGSEKLLSSDFNVIIWGKSKSELDDKTDEILKTFRTMNQAEGLQETLASKEVFLKSLPGRCEGVRHKKMKSSNASHLMPVFASWSGNPRAVCLLPTRDGRLFSLDPYADHLPAWNGIVFGGSGSGKSYTVVQLMAMFYGKTRINGAGELLRPRIVWIDNGASSKRLIEILDGEFLDLNLDSNLCLNMFDLKEGRKGAGSRPDSYRSRCVGNDLERRRQKGPWKTRESSFRGASPPDL
jgi:conjugal transfer ATP-binding protein TraC